MLGEAHRKEKDSEGGKRGGGISGLRNWGLLWAGRKKGDQWFKTKGQRKVITD